MVGLEVGEFSLHSGVQELNNGPAVVCLFLYYLSEFGVDAPVCSARVSALSSCGGLQIEAVDEFLGFCAPKLFEESYGVHAVAFFEAGEFAIHDGEKELDDGSAVVGLFHDDVVDRFGEVGL